MVSTQGSRVPGSGMGSRLRGKPLEGRDVKHQIENAGQDPSDVWRSREQWFRRYNAKAPEKGGAKKSRTMMSREWVKDTREAWERAANEALRRAGCGERIDHRSLAERRDEAERSGDLEQAAE